MSPDQLRQALRELNGQRDTIFYFADAEKAVVTNAMLIPDEPDHLVKVTDGKHVFVIHAERVVWIKIG